MSSNIYNTGYDEIPTEVRNCVNYMVKIVSGIGKLRRVNKPLTARFQYSLYNAMREEVLNFIRNNGSPTGVWNRESQSIDEKKYLKYVEIIEDIVADLDRDLELEMNMLRY